MSNEQPLPTDLELTALDPVFREHPHNRLDRLRTEDPVHFDAELGRLFLTRFEDMKAVLADRSLSKDPRKAPDTPRRRAMRGDAPLEAFQPSMLNLDDPDHKRLRALVSQAFNQRSIDTWRPRIRAVAEGLLDTLADRRLVRSCRRICGAAADCRDRRDAGRRRRRHGAVQALVRCPGTRVQPRSDTRANGRAERRRAGAQRLFCTRDRRATRSPR